MLRNDYLHSLWAFEHGPPVERLLADKPEALLLQTSYVAGFQYHMGEALWIRLAIGDALQLIREPENRYDRQAVRVEWKGHKIGYMPRLENHAVAQLLDRGKEIDARIEALRVSKDPWKRMRLNIYIEV